MTRPQEPNAASVKVFVWRSEDRKHRVEERIKEWEEWRTHNFVAPGDWVPRYFPRYKECGMTKKEYKQYTWMAESQVDFVVRMTTRKLLDHTDEMWHERDIMWVSHAEEMDEVETELILLRKEHQALKEKYAELSKEKERVNIRIRVYRRRTRKVLEQGKRKWIVNRNCSWIGLKCCEGM